MVNLIKSCDLSAYYQYKLFKNVVQQSETSGQDWK